MSMEHSRRERFGSQPIPLTWEMPLLIAAVTLFLVVMTPLVVQGAACAVVAGGFSWPSGQVPAALLGLARGDFGMGLPTRIAGELPPDAVLWAATLVAEILVLGSILILCQWLRELAGIGSRRGLATSAQAADALGIKALRTKAPMIRPDLPTAPGLGLGLGSRSGRWRR